MNPNPHTSPLRIEIRPAGKDGLGGESNWVFLDTAQTESQAADKIKRHRIAEGYETRVVPNDPISIPVNVVQDSPETKQFLERMGNEAVGLKRQLHAATTENEKLKEEKLMAEKIDALAGQTPAPFKNGQHLRDVHTGVAVRVTEADAPHWQIGNDERGFKWVNLTTKEGDKDHTGFCPFKSAGCFQPIDEGAPARAEATGQEVPDPNATTTSSAAISVTATASAPPRRARAAKKSAAAKKPAERRQR